MRFKGFKSKLTREYVLPLIDDPPERSDEFLEKRSKNVENRKKLKHDHRLGRNGYTRMIDDLPEDDKGRISGDNAYGHATAWKLACQDKKGTYKDNTIKDITDRMDEFFRQIQAGTTSSQGANDPLTLALGNVEHPGRSEISDDGNRFNALQKGIEKLEKELEDSDEVNRGQVQLLTDTVKEKERCVEELERQLRVNLADVQKLTFGVKEKERSAKTLERQLMQMRAELDDMRQRPASPPTPAITNDVVKEFDEVQYIIGFSDHWLRKHTAGDMVTINYSADLFGEVVTGMISYVEAIYVSNQEEFAHTTMNLFMW
ncbi:hypothetical protein Dimus_016221 [Dionaea muscipula]